MLLVLAIAAVACTAPASPTGPTQILPTAATAPTLAPVPATAASAASSGAVGLVYFFFSTLCSYCDEQAVIVEKFHQENPNIRIVGEPFFPQYATHELIQAFASRDGLTFEMREDGDLVKALGEVRRHPLIAFQTASGGPLVIASVGEISEQTLAESFQSFISGGSVTQTGGPG